MRSVAITARRSFPSSWRPRARRGECRESAISPASSMSAAASSIIECRGSGSPTVILISGYRNDADIWSVESAPGTTMVLPGVAAFTRVCAYDRPGTILDKDHLSRSDAVPMPRTADAIVAELHELLAAAHVAGPYVLVAHSLGGLFARLYASTYPDEVAGMVLVDAGRRICPRCSAPINGRPMSRSPLRRRRASRNIALSKWSISPPRRPACRRRRPDNRSEQSRSSSSRARSRSPSPRTRPPLFPRTPSRRPGGPARTGSPPCCPTRRTSSPRTATTISRSSSLISSSTPSGGSSSRSRSGVVAAK